MRRVPRFICLGITLAALLLIGSSPALPDVPPLPKILEDVTKLDKPTISYDTRAADDPYIEEIRLVDLDGQNDRLWMRGTREIGLSGAPQWSPDGRRVAVVVIDSKKHSYAPYVIDLGTGKEKHLHDLLPRDLDFIHLNWSPDGRWLAMAGTTATGGRGDIYKMRVSDGKLVRLTHKLTDNNWLPKWSPDGKRIAFEARIDGSRDIYLIDSSDGKNRFRLTSPPVSGEDAFWSPDGRRIAFLSYQPDPPSGGRADFAEMYTVHPDGSNLVRLTSNDNTDAPLAWSPDSKWIVFIHYSRQEDGTRLPGLYRMHFETREIRLIKKGVEALNATWVLAGKSRFLSVNPSGKKKAQWGQIKAAGGSENSQAPQEMNDAEE